MASQNPFFPKLYSKLLLFVKNNNNQKKLKLKSMVSPFSKSKLSSD